MKYKNPKTTTDIIIEKGGKILLIKRKNKPFKDTWALPGGFIDCGGETLKQAAIRELKEETSLIVKLDGIFLFGVYSAIDRDPRGHVISHVYVAGKFKGILKASDDAIDAKFFSLLNLPKLAFDHNTILKNYIKNMGVK